MHRISLRLGALGLLLSLAVAGGIFGLARSSHDAAPALAAHDAPVEPYGDCRVYRDGTDLSVRIQGSGAVSQCATWAAGRSSAADFWTKNGTPPTDETYWMTCRFVAPDDSITITVLDSGGRTGGRGLCGEFASDGWTEDPGD